MRHWQTRQCFLHHCLLTASTVTLKVPYRCGWLHVLEATLLGGLPSLFVGKVCGEEEGRFLLDIHVYFCSCSITSSPPREILRFLQGGYATTLANKQHAHRSDMETSRFLKGVDHTSWITRSRRNSSFESEKGWKEKKESKDIVCVCVCMCMCECECVWVWVWVLWVGVLLRLLVLIGRTLTNPRAPGILLQVRYQQL